MSKLEVEYDYETDQEQARQSRDYLYRDFSYAIEFFVKENPMVLVENLKLWIRVMNFLNWKLWP